ncbi:UNVERIFIED_CONTAM: hypothetical protein FKN15_075944 [Acipenser sinensis]
MGPHRADRADRSVGQGTGGCRSGHRSSPGNRRSDVRSPRGSEAANRGSNSNVWQQPSDAWVLGESGAGNHGQSCGQCCRLLGSRSSTGRSRKTGRVSRSKGRGTGRSSAKLDCRGGGRGCGGGHQRKSCPMKEQGHATAGGEEVGGDRGTREEEPASRAPPPGPDLQDHSEPPQPNPQPERDAQRQEKREHSAGEGRIPESEGEGEFITQKKKKKIKNINEINSPESEGKAEQGSETLETQAGTVGDPAQPDSQPQQQQQPPPQTAEERADAGLEEDETSCGEGGDLDEGDISDSSLFSDIPDSQTVRRSIV